MIPQRKTQKLRSLAIEVEVGSGNVFADLGFENAEQMLVNARLVAKISEIIRRRRLRPPSCWEFQSPNCRTCCAATFTAFPGPG